MRSLDSPFCLLVLLLLKFFMDWLESDSKSISSSSSQSSSLSESQFSSQDSSGNSSSSICSAFSIYFYCYWSIKFQSSFSISLSIYIQLGTMLSSSSISEFSSSDSFLLALPNALVGLAVMASVVCVFFYYSLSSGMLSACECGMQPCSCAQCSCSKQKPMLTVTLDIKVIYNSGLISISQICYCCNLYTNTNFNLYF